MKISLFIIMFLLFGCSIDSTKNEFRLFQKYKKSNQHDKALKSLNKIISTSKNKSIIKSAYLEMSELNSEELKSPEAKINIYKKLSILSENITEKNEYKYLIAKIYLDNLSDFENAISIAKNIDLDASNIEDKIKIKKVLIKSYRNKKKYFQALIEVNNILKIKNIKDENLFDIQILKANILSLEKKHTESNLIYESLIKKYPSKAITEKLYLSILTNYEAIGAYDKAIELLEKSKKNHKNNEKFIISKLKRLNDLKRNMPGAKGLRR